MFSQFAVSQLASALTTSAGEAPEPPARQTLAVEASAHEGATFLTLKGQLTSETSETAEARILTATVLTERPLRLVLDLTEVDSIDQHGITLLTKARFAVRAARGTLRLIAPHDGAVYPSLNRYLRKITVPRWLGAPVPDAGGVGAPVPVDGGGDGVDVVDP